MTQYHKTELDYQAEYQRNELNLDICHFSSIPRYLAHIMNSVLFTNPAEDMMIRKDISAAQYTIHSLRWE